MEKLYFGCFDGLRGTGIEMTLDQALSCSHQGDCDDDVSALLRMPAIALQFDALDPETIAEGLRESGAWDDKKLSDNEHNRHRALWSAACDIKENQDDRENEK